MAQRLAILLILYFSSLSFTHSKGLVFLQSNETPVVTATDDYSENPEDYIIVKGKTISKENCPSPHSIIGNNEACKCEAGTANYPFAGVKGVFCQYTMHKQLTSFLLEFFLNMGVGHFVIGQYVMGAIKIVVLFAPCILGCLSCCGVISMKKDEGGPVACCMCVLTYFLAIGVSVWWLVDAIMFGINKYRDGNNVPLQHW